ncbi:hypothetical protein E9099_02200 [Psychroserpens sp. NJDZ02]|nr:hypothetical protein E9099_02200 [Psychroserpens sp. NJDZ02]
MKITIIGPPAFGYTKYIYDSLKKIEQVEVNIFYIDRSTFKYKNKAHKIKNFLLKIFFGVNLKKKYQDDIVKDSIKALGGQDFIFTIRPDLLKNKTLAVLKSSAKHNIAFYYDSITRFSRKGDILPYFDKVYSYDKEDIEVHGFDFLTNYIYQESNITQHEYIFFNISSYDFRFKSLDKLAKYINDKGWSSKILVHHPDESIEKSEYLEIINQIKSVSEINDLMKHSKIIIEIQRNDQIGLSFRIFEALGHNKKLITTNKDIVNYDFYNPQNILVIDENYIEIPEDFVNTPYQPVDEAILDKYRIDNWVKPIFNLE